MTIGLIQTVVLICSFFITTTIAIIQVGTIIGIIGLKVIKGTAGICVSVITLFVQFIQFGVSIIANCLC